MESLDPSNHKEFIIGILFLLFKFKLDRIATDKAKETFSSYKNLFKPKKNGNNNCFKYYL